MITKLLRISTITYAAALLISPTALAANRMLEYSGLTPELEKQVEANFPGLKSRKISEEELDNILRLIQSDPSIKTVKAFENEDQNKYIVSIEHNKIVSSVSVHGNESISTSEVLRLLGINVGSSLDTQDLVDAGDRIHSAYKSLGYYNPTIDILMPPVSNTEVGIEINIRENRKTKIKTIKITSDNKSLNKSLVRNLKNFVGDSYTENKIQEIESKIQSLLTKNRYIRADLGAPKETLNASESEATLEFIINKPEQYQIKLDNLNFFESQGIREALNIEEYYSSSPNVAGELALKIKNYYLTKGHARAEAKPIVTELSGFRSRISFDIDPGPKVKILKYEFSGNLEQESKEYIEFIQEHSSETIANGFYNKDDLDYGVKNLILDLQNRGYLHAKLNYLRTQYNRDRNAVTVLINLDAGPLTQLERIDFQGNQNISSADLQKVSGVSVGPLRLTTLESTIGKLKKHYHDNGYLEMTLENERTDLIQYSQDNSIASVKFLIKEGPQVRASSIALEGNSFTKDYVIRKELEFTEGDLITPNKINESIARLQRTGFFSSVDIQTLEQKTDIAERTIIVRVKERDPGVFTLGAGVTNERDLTLRGYTGISYRNLLGTGRGLSMRVEGNYNIADVKYLEHRVVLGYLEPYLFNSRIRGRMNLSKSSEVMSYDLRQVSDTQTITYSLENDFTSKILGIWDLWSLASMKDYGIDDDYPFDTIKQDIASTGPQLDIDFRDNPFVPTKGTFTRWNAEFASPELGSSDFIRYWRTSLSFTHYQSIGSIHQNKIVWANQVRGGYMKNLEPGGGIPWDKKGFTLGGQSTVRGYEAGTQEVFPNRADLGLNSSDPTYYVTEQSAMYLFKSEIRLPVWESLGFAFFYDGGLVKVDSIEFQDAYRDSAGFGVRYNTPVGPVSLEFAWKLDQRAGEEPWRFHLSIGTF